MYRLFLVATLGSAACIGSSPSDETGTDSVEACALAADSVTCPQCSGARPLTCSFGDTSVTVDSCGECQSRAALYQALCDAGETADRATIEADTVCAPPTCVEWINVCADPCAPQCTREDQLPVGTTTCTLGCADTALPDPGDCVWTGAECAFE